jgi:YidC/Oxa1 family membrane protein insertase
MGSLFSFISDPLASALAHLALFVGNAGVSIILFTVAIRLVLSPLQVLQLRSARAMQRLQPHLQELKKKHGKDRQKMTEETMRLYREHKVNPAMGCLPMLLQLPVLIGLFWALRSLGGTPTDKAGKAITVNAPWLHSHARDAATSIWNTAHSYSPKLYDKWLASHSEKLTFHAWQFQQWLHNSYPHGVHVFQLFHSDFLWLSHGLGQPDPLFILPVLAGASQWIQSRMMMQRSTDPQQQTMNVLMNFTPLIIVFFAWRYPSGLSLYWVTSTIFGIALSVPITGWGSLPRFGPFAPPAPASAFVPRPVPRPSNDGIGPAEEESAGDDSPEGGMGSRRAGTNGRRRPRTGKNRGGRRG